MGATAEQCTAGATGWAEAKLEYLRWAWGEAYEIGLDDGLWWFRRLDGEGDTRAAGDPEELRDAIISDYILRPVRRDVVQPDMEQLTAAAVAAVGLDIQVRIRRYQVAHPEVDVWHDAAGWHARWPVKGARVGILRPDPVSLLDLLEERGSHGRPAGGEH